MEINDIKKMALDSANQILDYLEAQKNERDRGEQSFKIKKIRQYGDGVIMLTLFNNLNDVSLTRLEVGGKKIKDELYEFVSYDNITRTLEMKAVDELYTKITPGKENDVVVIHDFKFLIVRIRDYLEKYGDRLRFPSKGAMQASDFSIKTDRRPSESQINAINNCLTEPMAYIWGAPGTGKTQFVLANSILNDIRNRKKVAIFAPTNVSVEQVLYGLIAEIKHNPEFSKEIDLDRDILRIGFPTTDFAASFPNMCERNALVKNYKVYQRTIEALQETKNEMIIDQLEDEFLQLRNLLDTYNDLNPVDKEKVASLFNDIVSKSKTLPFMEGAVNSVSKLDMQGSLDRLIKAAYSRPRPRRFMQEYSGFTIEDIDELITKQQELLGQQSNCIRPSSNAKTEYYKMKYSRRYREAVKSKKTNDGQNTSVGGATLDTAKIIVCTPHQFVHRMIPEDAVEGRKHRLDVGHIYVDEVGYANLMNILPLFTNDCPITFLGDHLQLEPVFTMGKDKAVSEIRNGGQYNLAFLWGTSAIYLEHLFFDPDLSVLRKRYIENHQPQYQHMKLSLLKESYRFGENLAKILDENVYGHIGLKGVSHDGELKISCFSAKGVKENNYNQAEVNAVSSIIEDFVLDECRSIAVLTPYNNQIAGIRDVIDDDIETMTIHKSQGREWETVIVSVTDTNPHGRGFMDTRALSNLKLVNTAVSRTKKHLIIVCDFDSWIGYDDELISKLIEYARSTDELYEES